MATALTWVDVTAHRPLLSTSNYMPSPASVIAVNAPSTDSTDPSQNRVSGIRRGWITALIVGAPLVLAGCNAYPSYGADPRATKQGNDTFKLYSGTMTTGIDRKSVV